MTTEAQIEAAALAIIDADRGFYGDPGVGSLDNIDPAEAIRARFIARAALEAAERAAWRPVAEAPQDVVEVLVSLHMRGDPARGRITVLASKSPYEKPWRAHDGRVIAQPTHFRPVPDYEEGTPA